MDLLGLAIELHPIHAVYGAIITIATAVVYKVTARMLDAIADAIYAASLKEAKKARQMTVSFARAIARRFVRCCIKLADEPKDTSQD